ncbi:MAG: hypothetical protein DRJ07_14775, partial [Bacteroidetes bacterium]
MTNIFYFKISYIYQINHNLLSKKIILIILKNLSLSTKVLIGVFAGIFLGLFFGEDVGWLSIAGEVFIGLLQMTVLPYIMFSLIVNIGRLDIETGKRIIKFGLIFLSLLLVIGMFYLIVLPMAFPDWGSGNFY